MSVPLSRVLFPLRYDVWAQAPVIKRLAHLEGDELLKAAQATSIYQHVTIATSVYQAIPHLAQTVARPWPERSFSVHTTKLFNLYHSIKKGWDTRRHRLRYKRIVEPATTSAGHIVPADGLFLTNGQHRTAALLALGYTELPDYMACVMTRTGDFHPLDMTEAWIKAEECTEEKFVDFARFRFPDIPLRIMRIRALADWMECNGPEWAVEYIKIYWEHKGV